MTNSASEKFVVKLVSRIVNVGGDEIDAHIVTQARCFGVKAFFKCSEHEITLCPDADYLVILDNDNRTHFVLGHDGERLINCCIRTGRNQMTAFFLQNIFGSSFHYCLLTEGTKMGCCWKSVHPFAFKLPAIRLVGKHCRYCLIACSSQNTRFRPSNAAVR